MTVKGPLKLKYKKSDNQENFDKWFQRDGHFFFFFRWVTTSELNLRPEDVF